MPKTRSPVSDSLNTLTEQLVNRVLKPLGLVVISPERIRETLDEAAERGRVTRSDANELALELVRRGRVQTEELLSRAGLSDSVDRLKASADRARRTVGVGSAFPITGYEALTAAQIKRRLTGLNRTELRKVRRYEQRHAHRKTVLSAVDAELG